MATNFATEGEKRTKRDLATENVFRRTVARATQQGMQVNIGKTAMLTISAANTYKPEAYIIDQEGKKITGDSERVKLVGFHLSNQPNVSLHIS
jgi:hypothetical protein